MSIGAVSYVADGEKRRWPKGGLSDLPVRVTVDGVAVPYTVVDAPEGEIDIGYIPAEGAVITLWPSPEEVDYSLVPGENISLRQLPIWGAQYTEAMRSLYDTGGATSGTTSWWSIIDDDLTNNHANTLDQNNAVFHAPWSPGGVMLTYVRGVLKAYFSWTDSEADIRIALLTATARDKRIAI